MLVFVKLPHFMYLLPILAKSFILMEVIFPVIFYCPSFSELVCLAMQERLQRKRVGYPSTAESTGERLQLWMGGQAIMGNAAHFPKLSLADSALKENR